MKKTVWPLVVLFLLSCSREEPVRVRGTVTGAEGMIYLDQQGVSGIRKADSSKLGREGDFRLKDRIGVPTFYNLHLGGQSTIPLLLHPGETVEIRTSLDGFARDYQLSGSQASLYLQDLDRRLAQTRKSLDSLAALFEGMQDAGRERMQEILAAQQEIIRSQRRFTISFILEHLNSMASIYALYQQLDDQNYILNTNRDIQLFKITGMALDTLYPESEYVRSLKQDAANLEQGLVARNWQDMIQTLPATFPEIRLPDPRGDTIQLSSLSGKVVLLSFWASWNEESVVLNQYFKQLYREYHDRGFEIYQISFDNDRNRWAAAIQYDELPWINVSELSYPESSVAGLYNITELPTFFLLDPDGTIAGKNYDRIALERKIAELVHQNRTP